MFCGKATINPLLVTFHIEMWEEIGEIGFDHLGVMSQL
jgi:hypothetical protein